jgi:RNA-binding motif X-linked protein 2
MNKIKHIERITQRELDSLTPINASWHFEYRNSAYLFLGGLNYRMNEGDLVTVFSQYGEVVDCRLARDKTTGRSRGFGFLAYEDQRSTVLAVDNLNGIELCGRTILVDHVREYKIPREYMETEEDKKKKREKE